MKILTDAVASLWQVLVVALVLGAGLPTLFAVSVRLMAAGTADGTVRKHAGLHALGRLCLVVVGAAVVTGILFIMKDFLSRDLNIHIF